MLSIFKFRNKCYKQLVRAGKVEEKNGVICLVSISLPKLWSLNCLKINIFFAILSSPQQEIEVYKSNLHNMYLNDLVTLFQKMLLFMLWLTVLEILFLSRKILLNFCWVSISFAILIATISWSVAQNPIDHIIFLESVMRAFRYTYVNCFSRLRFLAKFSTELQKMIFWTI